MLGELNHLRVQTRYRTHARPATLFELSRAIWKYLTNAIRLKINHFTKTLLLLLVRYRPITAFGVWVESERLPRVSCRVHTYSGRMNENEQRLLELCSYYNQKYVLQYKAIPQNLLQKNSAKAHKQHPTTTALTATGTFIGAQQGSPGSRRNAITPRRLWFRTQQHYIN